MFAWLRKMFGGGNPLPAMRDRALRTRRAEIGMADPPPDAPIWGLLMETGYPDATATLVALGDGTTSLYLSSGGGVIGGQAHEPVRQANAAFRMNAKRLRPNFRPTTAFPLPNEGRTVFYALTDGGVLTAGAPTVDLGEGRHPLAPLFHAGHDVLTQLRLISGGASGA